MTDPITVDVDVRYRDLDTMNHVNNAVYASYFEEARVAYVDEVFDVDLENLNFVIAHLEIDFGRPLTIEDDPTVTAEVTELGNSSATMAYDLRVDGDSVATGESTVVFVDPETKRPGPIPAAIRERIVAHEGPELEE
ncbi:acyl-CoA thioesterase [Halopiger thermotolerans]